MRHYIWVRVVLLVALPMSMEATPQNNALYLETPRDLDEAYMRDQAEYRSRIEQLQYQLSVRANERLKRLLRTTRVLIVNRGRSEALSSANVVYFDIAVLDLLANFSDELSLAEVKKDAIHQLTFNLAYAAALNGDKTLALLDPHNTMIYTEEQTTHLWKGKLRAERVIFDQILGFILAHEFSHLFLEHDQAIRNEFPDEHLRNTSNPDWNRRRREIELAADEMAARICLNALIQPAQLIPWLDLNEIRRRFYGTSSEYPTAAQRIAVIQHAYSDVASVDALGGDLREFSPLAPHMDVAQTDYNLFLDELLKVRAFGQILLSGIDQTMTEMLENSFSAQEIADTFIILVEQQKDLLKGAENKDLLGELIQLIPSGVDEADIDLIALNSLIRKAGIGPYAEEMLASLLEEKPVNWKQLAGHLEVLNAAPKQFLLGTTYDYLLANTALRWHPELFSALQGALPESNPIAERLKPYRLDKPVRPPLPTFEERVLVLRTWNGEYMEMSGQSDDELARQ